MTFKRDGRTIIRSENLGAKTFESPIMTCQNTSTISKCLFDASSKYKNPCFYTSDGINNDASQPDWLINNVDISFIKRYIFPVLDLIDNPPMVKLLKMVSTKTNWKIKVYSPKTKKLLISYTAVGGVYSGLATLTTEGTNLR